MAALVRANIIPTRTYFVGSFAAAVVKDSYALTPARYSIPNTTAAVPKKFHKNVTALFSLSPAEDRNDPFSVGSLYVFDFDMVYPFY